jgi:uncharacterized membrane-anchored protein YjiN (DUF445 family)
MLVTCRACGKKIEKEDAFCFVHETKTGKKQNQYYCSQEEKEFQEREKELYKKIQYLTDEILGYPITNNARNKKIQELQQAGYTNEQIYRCVKDCKKEIEEWLTLKDISVEYQKISYMFAIIGNKIHDFTIEDKQRNDWTQYNQSVEQEVEDMFEESDDDIRNRLKNRDKKENTISDFLKGIGR